MTSLLITGEVTINTMVYLNTLPDPVPGTVFAHNYHETVGGTAAGKALNLNRLGLDVVLYHLIGDDPNGYLIQELSPRTGYSL